MRYWFVGPLVTVDGSSVTFTSRSSSTRPALGADAKRGAGPPWSACNLVRFYPIPGDRRETGGIRGICAEAGRWPRGRAASLQGQSLRQAVEDPGKPARNCS